MKIVSGATYLLVVEAWVEAETTVYPVDYWGPRTQPMQPAPLGVRTERTKRNSVSTVTPGKTPGPASD